MTDSGLHEVTFMRRFTRIILNQFRDLDFPIS